MIEEGWYEDADGDLMPASVEAWDDLFDEAEADWEARGQTVPGFTEMTLAEQEDALCLQDEWINEIPGFMKMTGPQQDASLRERW